MREALIEFLIQECETERDASQVQLSPKSQSLTQSTPSEHESQKGSPKPSLSAAATVKSIVPKMDAVTKVPHRKRSPNEWDDMTVVWTTKDGLVRRTGPKRTMTEQERAEYQLRRAQSACAVCRKKKRKVRMGSSETSQTANFPFPLVSPYSKSRLTHLQ